jgi:hypothetical protein
MPLDTTSTIGYTTSYWWRVSPMGAPMKPPTIDNVQGLKSSHGAVASTPESTSVRPPVTVAAPLALRPVYALVVIHHVWQPPATGPRGGGRLLLSGRGPDSLTDGSGWTAPTDLTRASGSGPRQRKGAVRCSSEVRENGEQKRQRA